MCLCVPISTFTRKSVRVYKILEYKDLKSPIYGKKYIPEHEYCVPLPEIANGMEIQGVESSLEISVSEGLHCYSSLKQALYNVAQKEAVFIAEVPAGSSIIYGERHEAVTNRLVVLPYYYKPVRILGETIFYRKFKYKPKEEKQ